MGTATIPAQGLFTANSPSTHVPGRRQQTAPRILVVEDEPVTAEVFAQALQKEGHRVRVARDGHQATHALRDQPPDLVVLDMGLPAVPGAELLRRLRSSAGGHCLPVIVVSASERTLTGIGDELLLPGRWVRKPVRPRELVAAVRAMLAGSEPGA